MFYCCVFTGLKAINQVPTPPQTPPQKTNSLKKRKTNYPRSPQHSAKQQRVLEKEPPATDNDWQCYYCQKLYSTNQSSSPWVPCDTCDLKMHVSCVSNAHKKITKLVTKSKSGKEFQFSCENCHRLLYG